MKGVRAFEHRNQEFIEAVRPHLKRLHHVARHEVAYFQAVGDLLPGELTPDEVVDAVLISAYREFLENPPARPTKWRSRLIRLAVEYLEAEARRRRREHDRMVHIEEDVAETPPTEQVSTLGEEILEFFEPDEDLKLEDVIPDLDAPDPEEETARKELRQCVNAALAEMPREWRRALLLRHWEGLSVAELANTLGMTENEVDGLLKQAGERLRQRLIEAGCRFREGDGR